MSRKQPPSTARRYLTGRLHRRCVWGWPDYARKGRGTKESPKAQCPRRAQGGRVLNQRMHRALNLLQALQLTQEFSRSQQSPSPASHAWADAGSTHESHAMGSANQHTPGVASVAEAAAENCHASKTGFGYADSPFMENS